MVARGSCVIELIQGLLYVRLDGRHNLEVVSVGLPMLDVVDNFKRLLTFTKVHQTSRQVIRITVLNELQG